MFVIFLITNVVGHFRLDNARRQRFNNGGLEGARGLGVEENNFQVRKVFVNWVSVSPSLYDSNATNDVSTKIM